MALHLCLKSCRHSALIRVHVQFRYGTRAEPAILILRVIARACHSRPLHALSESKLRTDMRLEIERGELLKALSHVTSVGDPPAALHPGAGTRLHRLGPERVRRRQRQDLLRAVGRHLERQSRRQWAHEPHQFPLHGGVSGSVTRWNSRRLRQSEWRGRGRPVGHERRWVLTNADLQRLLSQLPGLEVLT